MVEFDEKAMKHVIDACLEIQAKKQKSSNIKEAMAMVLMMSCSQKIESATKIISIFSDLTPEEKLSFAGSIYEFALTCDDIIKKHENIPKETSNENNEDNSERNDTHGIGACGMHKFTETCYWEMSYHRFGKLTL